VTDTRIVIYLAQASPVKHIANANAEPLILDGGGDIKAIVGGAFLPCAATQRRQLKTIATPDV